MTTLVRFEEPHLGLEDSYRDLVREFGDAGEPRIPFPHRVGARCQGALTPVLGPCVGFAVDESGHYSLNSTSLGLRPIRLTRDLWDDMDSIGHR